VYHKSISPNNKEKQDRHPHIFYLSLTFPKTLPCCEALTGSAVPDDPVCKGTDFAASSSFPGGVGLLI